MPGSRARAPAFVVQAVLVAALAFPGEARVIGYQRPITELTPMTEREIRAMLVGNLEFFDNPSGRPAIMSTAYTATYAQRFGDWGGIFRWTVKRNRVCLARRCNLYFRDAGGRAYSLPDDPRAGKLASRMAYRPARWR